MWTADDRWVYQELIRDREAALADCRAHEKAKEGPYRHTLLDGDTRYFTDRAAAAREALEQFWAEVAGR